MNLLKFILYINFKELKNILNHNDNLLFFLLKKLNQYPPIIYFNHLLMKIQIKLYINLN